MHRFSIALIVLSGLALGNSARATTFPIASVLTSGTLAGTITIDTVSGLATAGDFTIISNGTTFVFAGPNVNYSAQYGTNSYFASFVDTTSDSFSLVLPTPTLIGYNGGPICSYALICNGVVSGFFDNTTTPGSTSLYQSVDGDVGQGLSPVPEPSSLTLLVTGSVAAAAALRRRVLRA